MRPSAPSSPISGVGYPWTAPIVNPRTRCRWSSIPSSSAGISETIVSALASPYWLPWKPAMLPTSATGRVSASVRVSTSAKRNSVHEKMNANAAAETMPGAASGQPSSQRLQPRAAVDQRSVLELRRHLAEVRVHHPHGERQREDRVEQDQAQPRCRRATRRSTRSCTG